jgi:hypothetical protein
VFCPRVDWLPALAPLLAALSLAANGLASRAACAARGAGARLGAATPERKSRSFLVCLGMPGVGTGRRVEDTSLVPVVERSLGA